MPTKTLNTRIKLKYDTLANWTSANPVLLAGEVAVVSVPTGGSLQQVTPPAIVFKVGDDTSDFNTLPYASGLAADVYAWAKAATKPSYTVSEISGAVDSAGVTAAIASALAELDFTDAAVEGQYVSSVSQVDGVISVTRAALPTVEIPEYTLVVNNDNHTFELQKDGSIVGSAISYVASVTTGSSNGTISVNGSDVAVYGLGSAAYTNSSAYDAAGAATSAVSAHNSSGTAHQDIRNSVSGIDTRLTTAEDEIDTLQSTVAGLGNALHFAGAGASLPASGEDGDVYVITSGDDAGKEYIWANDAWQEFGDTSDYLLAATAAATYVPQTRTVNGHQLNANVTLTAADVNADAAGTAAGLIAELDMAAVSVGAGETISSISQADGVVSVSKQSIQIAQSQVSGLSTALAGKQDTLSFTDSAVSNQYVTSVVNNDGSVTTTKKQIAYSEISGTPTIPAAKTFAAGTGLSVSDSSNTVTYNIDESVTFVFDCGSATTNIDAIS